MRERCALVRSMAASRPCTVHMTLAQTREQLSAFDGSDGGPIYMGMLGDVFDVTKGKGFYGKGRAYGIFAGQDASSGLGTMKKNPEYRFQLDRKMWRLLQLLRKQHLMRGIKSGPILLNKFWKGMMPNSFTNWMKREMGKLESCKGKSVSCLGIRHSVITHQRRHDSTLDKRKEFARCCMHSESMNEQYRVH